MSDSLEEIFKKISRDVSTIHVYLQLYEQVYGSKDVIKVVNDSAKYFFARTQYVFIDNIILSISRLLDPAKMGGFENLSLEQLLIQVKNDENSSGDLTDRLEAILQNLEHLIATFEKHRNKRIAHIDLEINQSDSDSSLPEISEDNLYEIVSHLDHFMNEINYYYNSANKDYNIVLPKESDGKALIYQLIKGKAYQKLEDDGKIEKNYWLNVYPSLP